MVEFWREREQGAKIPLEANECFYTRNSIERDKKGALLEREGGEERKREGGSSASCITFRTSELSIRTCVDKEKRENKKKRIGVHK